MSKGKTNKSVKKSARLSTVRHVQAQPTALILHKPCLEQPVLRPLPVTDNRSKELF
jgi:hypothetical protein